jgi:hypothetical protein
MPNDLAIQPLTSVRTGSAIVGEAKTANQPPPQPEPAANPSPTTNPSLRLDPALGIVVLEFRNDAGAVTTSVPSQRQLQAYQRWAQTHSGQTPRDGASPPDTSTPMPAQHAANSAPKPVVQQHSSSRGSPPV